MLNQSKIPGTVVLTDSEGRNHGLLETMTGRVLDSRGRFTGTTLSSHGKGSVDPYPEDGDVLMSQVAARYYGEQMARRLGRKSVMMRDHGGGGMQVNLDLAQSDVHIPAALSNFAGGYHLEDEVADLAAPVIPVAKQSNKYFVWDSANAFKRVNPNIATPGASPGMVNPTLSNNSYSAQPYALQAHVPTEIDANADAPLRPYQAAVMRVVNALRLEREFRVATKLTTSTNWNSNNVLALAAGAQWNEGASSNPVANLHQIMRVTFQKITKWIFTEPAYQAFVRNSAVRAYWAYKNDAASTTIPSPDQISALLKIAPIVIAGMKYSSGGNATYVWPSAAGSSSAVVAVHEPPENPPTSQDNVATIYTMRWTGAPAPDGTVTAGFMVRSFFDPKMGPRGGRIVVVVHNDDEVMTSNIVGGLITGVIQ